MMSSCGCGGRAGLIGPSLRRSGAENALHETTLRLQLTVQKPLGKPGAIETPLAGD